MATIIPAVLPKNYEDLKNHIALVRGVSSMVQIDICDGIFVKNITWPFLVRAEETESFLENSLDEHFKRILNEEEGMPFWEDIDFELDLMVVDAVENFDIYTKLGPKRIIFHIEAVGDLDNFKNFLEGIDNYIRDSIEIGLAINTTSNIESIFSLISFVDFVQVMGIEHVGFQGEDFDDKCIDHIKTLREKFPELEISVDGAVGMNTAPLLTQAGATRLVVGSAIFNSNDIIGTIEELKQM
jgi:ribulose-phosphate 3-epimerase